MRQRKRVTVSIPQDLLDRLDREVKSARIIPSRSRLVEIAIAEFFGEEPQEHRLHKVED